MRLQMGGPREWRLVGWCIERLGYSEKGLKKVMEMTACYRHTLGEQQVCVCVCVCACLQMCVRACLCLWYCLSRQVLAGLCTTHGLTEPPTLGLCWVLAG